MKHSKKGRFVAGVVLASLLLLGGATAPGSLAGQGGEEQKVVVSGTVASKISYQGRMTDAQGNPLDGEYDLVFQIWDDATGGSQVGGDTILRDVPVADGLFTVELSVPQSEIHGQALWLQVQVEGQVLAPRQELLPVPYALSLVPGAQIYGPSQSALYLGSGSQDGVVGETEAPDKSGVFGHSDVGTGVAGYGPNNKGVAGYGFTGVYGRSEVADGEGVHGHGTAERTEGVLGTADGANGQGVAGYGFTGVYGHSDIADGGGVHGHGTAERTEGVLGTAEGAHGRGVWGIASGAGGDAYGVSGASVHADGVEGYTQAADRSGVFGHSDVGWGVYGISGAKPGVVGETSNRDASGVYGYSAVGAGVRGRSEGNAGVVGWTASTEASGVLGHSEVSVGVRGQSDAQAGVAGWTGSAGASGVYGHSQVGIGVKGESGGSHGVSGVTHSADANHAGVYARNDGAGPAIWAQGDGNSPAIWAQGDLYVTGAVRGSLPMGGASFPRPAYDSGVRCIASDGYDMNLDPGLPKPTYNPWSFVVDLQVIHWSDMPTSLCVGHVGGINWLLYDDARNTISVWRPNDDCPSCFRLRVWYVP